VSPLSTTSEGWYSQYVLQSAEVCHEESEAAMYNRPVLSPVEAYRSEIFAPQHYHTLEPARSVRREKSRGSDQVTDKRTIP